VVQSNQEEARPFSFSFIHFHSEIHIFGTFTFNSTFIFVRFISCHKKLIGSAVSIKWLGYDFISGSRVFVRLGHLLIFE